MRYFYLVALVVCFSARAESDFEGVTDAPPLAPPSVSEAVRPRDSLLGALGDSQLLTLGLRFDSQFVAGGAAEQGFSLPGARLTAAGEVGDHLDYRLSLGQAREFTTVMLPTIIPVEGYVDFNSSAWIDPGTEAKFRVRLGMFTPNFNPWWTPDLADVALPTYHEVHRSLFLSRDLGAELLYEPFADILSFSVGYFNGTGIFSVNTNSAHTFTGAVRATLPVGASELVIGVSAYALDQATPGSVSYKSNVIGDAYLSWNVPKLDFEITAEAIGGTLEDSTQSAHPGGGAGTFKLGVFDGIQAFARLESLRHSGSGSGTLDHYQFGPILKIHKSLTAYLLYDHTSTGGSDSDTQALMRVRFVL